MVQNYVLGWNVKKSKKNFEVDFNFVKNILRQFCEVSMILNYFLGWSVRKSERIRRSFNVFVGYIK